MVKGEPRAIPHVWLWTKGAPHTGITDLSFTNNRLRAFPNLGMFTHLCDEACGAVYFKGAELPKGITEVYPGAPPVQELVANVGDVGRYLLRAPARIVDQFKSVFAAAIAPVEPVQAPVNMPEGVHFTTDGVHDE